MTNYLSKAPALPDVVTFDIADGSFEFYTKEEFEKFVDAERNELLENDMIEADDDLDVDGILSLAYGDEMFWDWLPGPA
jgi:hypothetical protein